MSHLRYNPLQGTYTMVAANRQNRPHLPKDHCPFCPGSGKVPKDYEVLVYPNDFPALSDQPITPATIDSKVYHTAEAHGHCDVILYSPDHFKGLAQLPLAHVQKLVSTWAERYSTLQADPKVRFVFPFESRGEEVGVTIHHPHGQLYAYPFVPIKVATELDNAKAYYHEHGVSMLDVMLQEEEADGRRVVCTNKSFTSFIPWFTDYPYGVYIFSKSANKRLEEMTTEEQADLADILQQTIGAFDTLFNKPFPYMMCLYQAPVHAPEYEGAEQYYPFHIKFFTPLRAADKIKWLASSETGAGAAANTLLVEDTAIELREALQKYKEGRV